MLRCHAVADRRIIVFGVAIEDFARLAKQDQVLSSWFRSRRSMCRYWIRLRMAGSPSVRRGVRAPAPTRSVPLLINRYDFGFASLSSVGPTRLVCSASVLPSAGLPPLFRGPETQ